MRNDRALRDRLIQGVRGFPMFKMTLYDPPTTFPALMAKLRRATGVEVAQEPRSHHRRHSGSHSKHHRKDGRVHYSDRRIKYADTNKRGAFVPKSGYKGCYVCKKPDCHSSNHTEGEIAQEKARYMKARNAEGMRATEKSFRAHVAYVEGIESDSDEIQNQAEGDADHSDGSTSSDTSSRISEAEDAEDGSKPISRKMFTAVFTASEKEYDARDVLEHLEERKAIHILGSMIKAPLTNEAYTTQWTDQFFHGLLLDTGASNRNTGGINQLKALQRIQNAKLDTSRAGGSRIRFGAGTRLSLGTVMVDTPIGRMDFTIVDADVPFLVCLQQLDKLHVHYDRRSTWWFAKRGMRGYFWIDIISCLTVRREPLMLAT